MGTIHVKTKSGQTFEYIDWPDGRRRYEVVNTTYDYTVVAVDIGQNRPADGTRSTIRQFPKTEVDTINQF